VYVLKDSSFVDLNANSYLIVENLHSQIAVEVIDFIVRRVENSTEQVKKNSLPFFFTKFGINQPRWVHKKAFSFQSVEEFCTILENLLRFHEKSTSYAVQIQPKLTFKLVKSLLPVIISNTNQSASPQSNVNKKKNSISKLIEKGRKWPGFYLKVYIGMEKVRFIKFALDCFEYKLIERNSIRNGEPKRVYQQSYWFANVDQIVLGQITKVSKLKWTDARILFKVLMFSRDMPLNLKEYLNENYSTFNSRYYKVIWSISEFLLSESGHFKQPNSAFIFERLLDKFGNVIELASPNFLHSLVKCLKCFIRLSANHPDEEKVFWVIFII